MLKIAVCDDEIRMTSYIESLLLDCSREFDISVDVDIFYTGKALLEYIENNNKYDMLYLDIYLRNENGVEIARKIRMIDKKLIIIFVTNYEGFAKEAFEVDAYRFISKPISKSIFKKYFISAKDRIMKKPEFFQFHYNKVPYRIPLNKIVYFKSDKRITYIITENKIYKCYEKLNVIEDNLSNANIKFLRIHQSFLVNPNYLEIYMYDSIQLKDGTILSISKNRRNLVSAAYCKLKGEDIVV